MLGNTQEQHLHELVDIDNRKTVRNETNFEPLLDAEEAARLLRMHPATIRRKAFKGTIPAIKLGGRWRFRISKLNQWLGEAVS
jgi:excisionase family DNA binding protein